MRNTSTAFGQLVRVGQPSVYILWLRALLLALLLLALPGRSWAQVPTLSAVAPQTASPGASLTLTGADLTGATSISFLGVSNNVVSSGFTVNSAGTQITGIVVPVGAQSGPVRVTTPGGTSAVGGVFFSRAATADGSEHSVSLRPDGTVWTWGSGGSGQLGNGTTTDSSTPVQVTSLGTGCLSVAASFYQTMAIKADGTLWAWGFNQYGQLGDGSTTNRSTPVQVGLATNWVSVAMGNFHGLGLRADGTLWAWGGNGSGQVGDGSTTNRSTPVQVGTATDWVSIAAGYQHSLAIKRDGTLWSWGYVGFGQLGNGGATPTVPTQVGTATNWVSVTAGQDHTLGLQANGTLWGWGSNGGGQFGDGTTTNRSTPWQCGTATNWQTINSGPYFTMAIKTDGTLWGWGSSALGQLGIGAIGQRNSPVQAGTATSWVSVGTGGNVTLAEQGCRSLWTCGANSSGQLGDGTTTNRSTLRQLFSVSSFTGFSPASATVGTTVTVTGTNLAGLTDLRVNGKSVPLANIGNLSNTSFDFVVPAGAASTGTTTARVGCGEASSTGFTVVQPTITSIVPAVALPGEVITLTGNNLTGATSIAFAGLGSPSLTTGFVVNGAGTQITGVVVPAGATTGRLTVTTASLGAGAASALFTKAATLDAGDNFTASLRPDGSIWSWGQNNYGQLGNSSTTNSNSPVRESSAGSSWVSVAAGYGYTMAIKANGTLWGWGVNNFGQLGDGTNVQRTTPVQIGTATNWSSVAGGYAHTVGVRTDGTLWSWGNNGSGQLGDGSPGSTTRYSPVQVGEASDWVSVTSGQNYLLALRADGTLWAWGQNAFGALGDGSGTDQYMPVQIGAATNWVSIAAGFYHGLAVRADGTLWAWGFNGYGQLGDNTTTNRPTPTQVGTATNWVSATGGDYFSLGVRANGTLWGWGDNRQYQLADGTVTQRTAPVQAGTATNWLSATAGNSFAAGEQSCRAVWAWGQNNVGQLGNGTVVTPNGTPARIYNPSALLSFSPTSAQAGATVTVTGTFIAGVTALTVHGVSVPLANIGSNTATSFTFVVPGGATATGTITAAVGCGTAVGSGLTIVQPIITSVSPAVGLPGTVVTLTGQNLTGTTAISFNGVGNTTITSGFVVNGAGTQITGVVVPEGVSSGGLRITTPGLGQGGPNTGFFTRAVTLEVGDVTSVAIHPDGTIWSTGYNNVGQLADGTSTNRTLPVQESSGSTNWLSLAVGGNHTLALKADGTLWAWGYNNVGQLGDASITSRTAPVLVSGGHTWASAAGGAQHTMAVRTDGTLWAWGNNDQGQFGDGTGNSNRNAPAQVGISNAWVSVAAGSSFTLALRNDGTL